MSVSLVCFPSPDSLEKKKRKNSTLTRANLSVIAFSVYTVHCCGPSATLLPVWLDMADHK